MTPHVRHRLLPASLRNWLSIVTLLFPLLTSTAAYAEDWQKLNPQGYVNDYAGVLDATTVDRLNRLSTELDQKAKAQLAVVTIKSLNGDTVEDFANRLFQKWGVGSKGTDRGVMLLLATEDHKYWTEVGYGLEPILPDGKVGTFGRGMIAFLHQGNYNAAVLQMASQIAQVIASDSHVSLESGAYQAAAPADDNPQAQEVHLSGTELVIIILVLIVLGPFLLRFLGPFLLYSILSGGGRGGWGGGGFGGGGGGGGFGGFGGGSSGGGGAGGSW